MKHLSSIFIGIIFTSTLFAASGSKFTVCKSTYAVCTTSPCTPVEGKKDIVNCHCKVLNGYSAAHIPCKEIQNTDKGKLVYSRYYPVHAYKICSNNRTWAFCLDKPCIVDPNDPTKANCACTPVANKGDYVLVTDGGALNSCDKGIVSSATIQQVDDVTNFLKTQKDLQPFEIKIEK